MTDRVFRLLILVFLAAALLGMGSTVALALQGRAILRDVADQHAATAEYLTCLLAIQPGDERNDAIARCSQYLVDADLPVVVVPTPSPS